jgi:hypothetical protein
MAIAALLALFPLLYLFAPRLALALLVLAIFLLYRKRVSGSRKSGARPQDAPCQAVAWKDPWGTEGLDR